MNRQHLDPERPHTSCCAPNGGRDIVELQVQEDRPTKRLNPTDCFRTLSTEQLKTDLIEANMIREDLGLRLGFNGLGSTCKTGL